MARMMLRSDGTAADYNVPGAASDGNHKVVDHPNLDAIVSAVVLVVMDEINALRTLGLIGLTARTADDWKTKIAAKLP
jgi:hypothetical protein